MLSIIGNMRKRHAEIRGNLNGNKVYLSGQDYRDLRNSSTFLFANISLQQRHENICLYSKEDIIS